MSADPALIVWYDGGCPLCRREIALMRRLDRANRVEFVDAASPATLCPLDRGLLLSRLHALENNVLHSGVAAFAAMWRAIPLLWPLGQAARLPPVAWLLDRAYRAFLKHRPALQRWLA